MYINVISSLFMSPDINISPVSIKYKYLQINNSKVYEMFILYKNGRAGYATGQPVPIKRLFSNYRYCISQSLASPLLLNSLTLSFYDFRRKMYRRVLYFFAKIRLVINGL